MCVRGRVSIRVLITVSTAGKHDGCWLNVKQLLCLCFILPAAEDTEPNHGQETLLPNVTHEDT